MTIRVLVFAALRDRLGFHEKAIELAAGATVETALHQLFNGSPPRALACAVNSTYAETTATLADGDELAVLPPVSGGAPSGRLQAEPIDVQALMAETADDTCGAVLVFLGTAREVPGETLVSLEYEAYQPMAEKFLATVTDELRTQFGVERSTIVHRTGTVKVGEPSVAIVVASPHRAAGFDALRHAIERIKAEAPIWKQEVTDRRARWVGAEALDTDGEPTRD